MQLDYQLCPHCEYEVKGDYLRCPSCLRKLKDRCHSCGKAVDPAWRLCPFCEAETRGARPRQAAGAAGAGSHGAPRTAGAESRRRRARDTR